MNVLYLITQLILVLILAGCSGTPERTPDLTIKDTQPSIAPTPMKGPRSPSEKKEEPTRHKTPSSIPLASFGRSLVLKAIPTSIPDRDGWATDIYVAFATLNIAPSSENICATIAVIQQESSFKTEPKVTGISKIVRRELERRRNEFGVPSWVMNKMLAAKSPDGRTYKKRIDRLETENDVNKLYEDMIAELPLGRQLLDDYNPVQTGGPMQVSVAFAKEQIQNNPYPYLHERSLRSEVFSRRGGLYFGIAYLLAYPANYDRMIFRFADFNAGRYASRNAAFQRAVNSITGIPLEFDGDLLRYKDGKASNTSHTLQAVLAMESKLGMTRTDVLDQLRSEKAVDFERSNLYKRVFFIADQSASKTVSRAQLPVIKLKSPKISRQLTTEWFARSVDARYQECLARYK